MSLRFLLLLFAVILLPTIPAHANVKLPQPAVYMIAGADSNATPAKWGRYTVTIDHDNNDVIRICVRNHEDTVVKEIDCGEHSQLYAVQLSKTGFPDLVVVAWSGSNLYCTRTSYVFSQQKEIRNVAIICGGEGKFESLSPNGLQFVLAESGVLEFACDVCHACEPSMPVILQWNNGHTVDVTRRFPSLSIAMAADYCDRFTDACRPAAHATNELFISSAAGYYANEYELGHGPKTYRWIVHRLPNDTTKQWFRSFAKVIRCQISQIKNMTTSSQNKVLSTDNENPFTNPPQFPTMDTLSE